MASRKGSQRKINAKLPKIKNMIRYNKFNTETRCRICLTQSLGTSLSLDAPLNATLDSEMPVVEVLELLTNETIVRGPYYPDTVCGMCLGYLKIAYEFIVQYKESKEILSEQLKESGVEKTSDIVNDEVAKEPPITKPITNKDSKESKAPVEIFIGTDKFDINDLFIVEDESEDESFNYDGFLQNLGTTISASFVEKGFQKPRLELEAPSFVIEKIGQEAGKSDNDNHEYYEEDFDSSSDLIDKSEQTTKTLEPNPICEDETIFMDKPNTEVIDNVILSNEYEKSAVESALRLKYKCPYCLKPMSTLNRAKIHSRKCNQNTNDVHCDICAINFKNRKVLIMHMKEAHLSDVNVDFDKFPKGRQHKCKLCDKNFKTESKLLHHIKEHAGEVYGCDKCDKHFFTQKKATDHARIHDKNQTAVMCQICGKGFRYKNSLDYHLKIHNNIRNLQCSYCPRRFYTLNSIKRHELTHTGARPYSCKFCDRKFRSVGETRKHQLLHTGERPYQCKYCSAGFTQKYGLKAHMTKHPGKCKCKYCDKGFTDMDTLRFHVKKKHPTDYKQAKLDGKFEAAQKDVDNNEDDIEDNINDDIEDNINDDIENNIDDGIVGEEEELSVPNLDYYADPFEEDVEEGSIESSDQLFEKQHEIDDAIIVETNNYSE